MGVVELYKHYIRLQNAECRSLTTGLREVLTITSHSIMMRLTSAIEAQAGQPLHTFEFFPPRTPEGLANLLDRIQRMTSAPLSPPVAISVTWGAGGSTATRSLELAGEIAKMELAQGKVQIILHLTCTNMGKKMVDEALKVSGHLRWLRDAG